MLVACDLLQSIQHQDNPSGLQSTIGFMLVKGTGQNSLPTPSALRSHLDNDLKEFIITAREQYDLWHQIKDS